MKHRAVTMVFALTLWLAACGGGNSSNSPVTGSWSASLIDQSGTTDFTFTTTLSQSGGTVSGANLSFTTGAPCFSSGTTTETGGFTLTGNMNGNTTGTLNLTIQSGSGDPDGNNTLTMQGTLNNNTVSGTWTLTGTGTGCTGSGTFNMNRS